MTHINQSSQVFEQRYQFPTIDFKFQNTGNATAFLWQFAILVLHIEIDIAPVLDFKLSVEGGALMLMVINNGWGDAYDCQIEINESTLNQLFPSSYRQYRGTIRSGESRIILSLTKEMADIDQFTIVSKEFKRYFLAGTDLRINGIKLGTLRIDWHCLDTRGIRYQENTIIASRIFSKEKAIALTQDGFFNIQGNSFDVMYCQVESDRTYSVIIDPAMAPHEQTYPISRAIPSGEIERFHIMLGTTKSCHLLIKFRFFIDQTTVIESEIFDLKVWNPRSSRWHSYYTDGSELRRDRSQLQEVIIPNTINYSALDFSSANIHRSSQFYEKTLAIYEKAIHLDPKDANSYYHLGTALYALKRYEEALDAYKRAVALDPKNTDYFYENRILFERKKAIRNSNLKRELIFNKEAIQLDSSSADAYYNLGMTLYTQGRYQEALNAFEETIRLDPNNVDAYYKKGHAFKWLGMLKEAQQSYEKARQLKNSS